ncbi:hypothetical protein ORJ04_16435 [Rheinheimera baltica]|uniref:Lipoprotein n=1 Tax=Rheinheimera baltica TaxID=67576 RepID=A0ABT9I2C8_9GAMM|nr:hypothetical protein [Rheinheimera baltica]MDP5137545.1 hypothetical protein [Rheinheimera baltica]
MKVINKVSIAFALPVLGMLIWFLVQPSSASTDTECGSNAYLIKHFWFNKGIKEENKRDVNWGDRIDVTSVPDELPNLQKTFFTKAMQLPIDASDQQVRAVFSSKPEIGELMGIKGFTLRRTDNKNQYTSMQIQKYKGCLSNIQILGFGVETYTLNYDLLVPSGYFASNKNRENTCQLGKIDSQQFVYTVNGVSVSTGKIAGAIPKPITEAFSDWGRFNDNSEYLYELLGEPVIKGTVLSWVIRDDTLGDISVEMDVEQYCSKALTFRWQQAGNQHQLLKLNIYS